MTSVFPDTAAVEYARRYLNSRRVEVSATDIAHHAQRYLAKKGLHVEAEDLRKLAERRLREVWR